jgi:hypothetical protein
MFNRNRIIGAAIGLMAFGVSSLSAQEIAPHAGDATKEGQRPIVIDNPKGQTETNKRAREGGTKTGNFCGASFALHCQPNAIPADEHEDARNGREERDIIAQESVADSTASILWWTRVQLLLSGLGIAGLGWTLYESRRAANAAVDGATAAHATVEQARETNRIAGEVSAVELRPWIAVKIKNISSFKHGVGKHSFHTDIVVSFENIGKTPAVDLNLNCKILLGGDNFQTDLLDNVEEFRNFVNGPECKGGAVVFPGVTELRRINSVIWDKDIRANDVYINHKSILPKIVITIFYRGIDRKSPFATGIVYDISETDASGEILVISPDDRGLVAIPINVFSYGSGFVT